MTRPALTPEQANGKFLMNFGGIIAGIGGFAGMASLLVVGQWGLLVMALLIAIGLGIGFYGRYHYLGSLFE